MSTISGQTRRRAAHHRGHPPGMGSQCRDRPEERFPRQLGPTVSRAIPRRHRARRVGWQRDEFSLPVLLTSPTLYPPSSAKKAVGSDKQPAVLSSYCWSPAGTPPSALSPDCFERSAMKLCLLGRSMPGRQGRCGGGPLYYWQYMPRRAVLFLPGVYWLASARMYSWWFAVPRS